MGCQACKLGEPEVDFQDFNYEDNNNNRNIIENTNFKKNNPEKFYKDFNSYIQNIGTYMNEKDFESMIPPNVYTIITENPFEPSNYLNKDLTTYQIKPVEFPNGNIYWGNWNENLEMEGLGRYYLKDDKVLAEGVWEHGELNYGRVFLPNGDVYEGEISNSSFNGKGKLTSNNGEIYQGEFVDGEKTGRGCLIFTDGTEYNGEISGGVFQGKGNMKWTNGMEYQGGFNGPTLSGYGILTNLQGDKYEGNFERNQFNGQGKYTYKNGDVYEGNFENGIKKGKGIFTKSGGLCYEGDWDNDVPYGFGKVILGDNSLKSTWRDGKMMEKPIYEDGCEEDFKKIDLNIIPNEMILNTNGLSHLENTDVASSQYRPIATLSFLG